MAGSHLELTNPNGMMIHYFFTVTSPPSQFLFVSSLFLPVPDYYIPMYV